MADRDNFLYVYNRYQGQFKPEKLMFNANLQEFSQRVSYICNLETGGKLSQAEAFEQISELWEELKRSQQELGIGNS